jgi:hypothetical protein
MRWKFPFHPVLPRWRRLLAALRDSAPALLVAITLAAPLMLMIAVLPWPMVLPVFSLWSLAAAALAALVAGLGRRRHRAGVTAWDVAGAFTFIGCAAAVFAEIEYVVEYLRPLTSRSEAHD